MQFSTGVKILRVDGIAGLGPECGLIPVTRAGDALPHKARIGLLGVLVGQTHLSEYAKDPRPSHPGGYDGNDNGGGETCDAAERAKNLWLRTGRQRNVNMAKFNARTACSEASIGLLFEEMVGIRWDIIGLSEIRRTEEGYTLLKNRHVLSYPGLQERRERGLRFLVNDDVANGTEECYSINDIVAASIIKLNKR